MSTERNNRRVYLTHSLQPAEICGINCHSAKTNAEWLRAECDRGRASGMPLVVVATPAGTQALAREGRIHPDDEIINPEKSGDL